MEKRHSSPCLMDLDLDPRPKTHRKRSNSFPIVDALGCSTPEARIIMAEGKAAVRSRQASIHRRGRRRPSPRDDQVYRPRDHLKYLIGDSTECPKVEEEPVATTNTRSTRHSRIPSNITDCSASTLVAHDQPRVQLKISVGGAPGSPLDDYSATLAQFIKSQLESIPSYHPDQYPLSPRSCPNLSPKLPVSKGQKRKGIDSIVEIPPIRPPLQSAFSAWSSTDDEIDERGDEAQPIPSVDNPTHHTPASNNYTPSILSFYETSNGSSFLFTSTPLEETPGGGEEEDPLTAKGFTFPDQSTLPGVSSPAHSHAQHDDDYPSSALSTHPQLSSSSAPSFSSTSTASYFDCKPPVTLAHVRARIVAAVAPNPKSQHLAAASPLDGGVLANAHDILIESQQRVLVDGMSFDMLRGFNMPEESAKSVSTPC